MIGVIHTINTFLPLIRKSSIKKVITITSGIGDIQFTLQSGFPVAAPSSISKAAVNLANAKYAVAHKAEGIIFLALSPGYVATGEVARRSPVATSFILTHNWWWMHPSNSRANRKIQGNARSIPKSQALFYRSPYPRTIHQVPTWYYRQVDDLG